MQTEPRSVTRPRDRARVRLRLRNNPASYLGRSTFRPAALASRRQMRALLPLRSDKVAAIHVGHTFD